MSDNEPAHFPKPARQYHLDLIRGLAVFLMIAAHAIDFYHDGSLPYLRAIVTIANTVCFSTFLFISGAVVVIAYLKRAGGIDAVKRHLNHRLLLFLFSYYVLALFSLSDKLVPATFVERWQIFLQVLTFRLMPSYTEFLFPFFVFSLVMLPLRRFIVRLSENWRLAALTALAAYALGAVLYFLPVPAYLIPWKALFVGSGSIFRFPILQYFPIYIAGLQWGNWLVANPHHGQRQRMSLRLTGILLLFWALAFSAYLLLGAPSSFVFLRWPPSLPFLPIGLVFIFMMIYLISARFELRHRPTLRDSLLILGQNAFALYWTHIFLLKLYRFSGGATVSSALVVVILFFILLITSLALATFVPFNFSFHLSFIRESGGRPFRNYVHPTFPAIYQLAEDVNHRTKLLYRASFLVAAVGLCLIVFSFWGYHQNQTVAKAPPATPWWNNDYAYNIPISLKNNQSFTAVRAGSFVSLTFDHRQLVEQKKALASGNDIRIVAFDGSNFHDIDRFATSSWDSSQTTLAFRLDATLNEGETSARYFLYYGDNIADPYSITKPANLEPSTQTTVTLGNEANYGLTSAVSRVWSLKSDGYTQTEPLVFTLNVPTTLTLQDPLAYYEVIGTNLRGLMDPVTANTWEASLDANSLPPGSYRARAHLVDQGATRFSQNAGFQVSYPLYVAWTQDWEGYDVPDAYLQAIDRLSQEHNLPVTHFFNPRIYTTNTISAARSQYLTDWVKNRRTNYGDEINLHLHMFPDFVSAAGIPPKTQPRWGTNQDGYDILTTAYNYEEMLKIITKAKQLFADHGLGTPLAYRAGGWYANNVTLQAIQDSGFHVDSSGRTAYKFGARQVPGFWQLTPTTKPYYPSTTNQNSSIPSPNLSLLEIPNNGADSYAFSDKQMIDRFNANYSSKPLLEKQQITYLTHPHWFNSAEQQRVANLFTYVDNYLNDQDRGPVRYVTTGQIYQAWTNQSRGD